MVTSQTKMRTLSIIVFTVVLLATLSCARSGGGPINTTVANKELSPEAQQIANERPEVSHTTLQNDEIAIDQAWPVISDKLQLNGFSEDEAREATLASWRDLRLSYLEPQEPLSPGILESYVAELGKLVINSTPADADIEIDGQAFNRKTNTAAWLESGSYKVKVSKSGFEPTEKSATVRKGEKTEVEFTLRQGN